MKKFIMIPMCLVLTVSFCACSSSGGSRYRKTSAASTAQETTVGSSTSPQSNVSGGAEKSGNTKYYLPLKIIYNEGEEVSTYKWDFDNGKFEETFDRDTSDDHDITTYNLTYNDGIIDSIERNYENRSCEYKFEYDSQGRVIHYDYAGNDSGDDIYTDAVDVTYSSDGKTAALSHSSQTYGEVSAITYDDSGNIESVMHTYESGVGGEKYDYDEYGNTTEWISVIANEEDTVVLGKDNASYDENNLLISYDLDYRLSGTHREYKTTIDYDENGCPSKIVNNCTEIDSHASSVGALTETWEITEYMEVTSEQYESLIKIKNIIPDFYLFTVGNNAYYMYDFFKPAK